MVDPASAGTVGGTALKLAESLSGKIEYWKKYKGARVQIRETTVSLTPEKAYKHSVFIVEGDIEDIRSLPPSFVLGNVEVYLEQQLTRGGRDTETVTQLPTTSFRETNHKIIAFSDISEMEFIDLTGAEADSPLESGE